MILLVTLGFTIHPEKSVLVPGHILIYLGFVLNSDNMKVTRTQEKKEKIKSMCEWALAQEKMTIRELAGIVGSLITLEPGAEFAPIYYRWLDIFKAHVLQQGKGRYDAKI